jgi:hypothetical protein
MKSRVKVKKSKGSQDISKMLSDIFDVNENNVHIYISKILKIY